MINIRKCQWTDIAQTVETYYETNRITVDSYWEDHVLGSNYYQFMDADKPVGYFAIHNQSLITLFNVAPHYANQAQALFSRIKQYEQVTGAFVATGDEFFLSHCIDNFARLEKQAYFSIYTDKPLKTSGAHNLKFHEIKTLEETKLIDLAEDFFDPDSAQKILDGLDYFKIYTVKENDELIGFGVIEYGRVLKAIGSVGMYVMPDKRQQGYAAAILKHLQLVVEEKGKRAHSGCWYYNHNSKKSMECAGAYSKTRLVKFYF